MISYCTQVLHFTTIELDFASKLWKQNDTKQMIALRKNAL